MRPKGVIRMSLENPMSLEIRMLQIAFGCHPYPDAIRRGLDFLGAIPPQAGEVSWARPKGGRMQCARGSARAIPSSNLLNKCMWVAPLADRTVPPNTRGTANVAFVSDSHIPHPSCKWHFQ